MTHKELVNIIKEEAITSPIKVKVCNAYDYISVDITEDDGYLFQGDDLRLLEDDYRNSGVCDDVSIEEYLKYVARDW